MKVTTVTATLRFSQDSGKGAWKSLELGAEAQVAPNEEWAEAQAYLNEWPHFVSTRRKHRLLDRSWSTGTLCGQSPPGCWSAQCWGPQESVAIPLAGGIASALSTNAGYPNPSRLAPVADS
jgi:hypothetical protein